MKTWKKDKIIERYYRINTDTGESGYFNLVTKNPTIEQVWFSHIRKVNIRALKNMLDEKVIEINVKHKEDGDSIVHYAVRKKSLVLLNFCLQNKADFNLVSNVEEETAYYEASYGYIGIKIFSKVFENINEEYLADFLLQKNCTESMLIKNLCEDNRNYRKILWLEKKYPYEWNEFKKKYLQKMIAWAEQAEANNNIFILKGLQKIKKQLENNLLINSTSKAKIKI